MILAAMSAPAKQWQSTSSTDGQSLSPQTGKTKPTQATELGWCGGGHVKRSRREILIYLMSTLLKEDEVMLSWSKEQLCKTCVPSKKPSTPKPKNLPWFDNGTAKQVLGM